MNYLKLNKIFLKSQQTISYSLKVILSLYNCKTKFLFSTMLLSLAPNSNVRTKCFKIKKRAKCCILFLKLLYSKTVLKSISNKIKKYITMYTVPEYSFIKN